MQTVIKTIRGNYRIVDDGEVLLAIDETDNNAYFTFAHGTTNEEMVEDIERIYEESFEEGDVTDED